MLAIMTSSSSVLIVDDERAGRDLMSRWVTALGLHAATATNADEALATLRAGRYDLAVVDGLMPGHDGQWLATELQREHPYTSVIIATAYSALLGEPPQSEIADLLVKPFQREGFAVALERGRQWRKQALEEGTRAVQDHFRGLYPALADVPRESVAETLWIL